MSGNKIAELKYPRSTLIALFKPRQVILAEQQQQRKPQPMAGKHGTQLLHSVLRYLQKNEFNKSFRRLLKEAKIEGHSWKDKALDLEDIFNKYLQSCNHVDINSKNIQEQAIQGEEEKGREEDAPAAKDIDGKKKKKKMAILDNRVTELDGSLKEEINLNIKESGDTVDVTNHNKKKQKKNRLVTESIDGDERNSDMKSGLCEEKPNTSLSEEIKDTKDKKKKNKPTTTDPHTENITSDCPEVNTREKKTKKETKEKKSLEQSEVGGDNKQIAKKRKRSNENEVQPAKETTLKDSKRRKSEGSEVNDKQIVASGLDKSCQRRGRNDSAEPKTVNAFQRVKIDEVEFVDDRLQDNSYWAKDGAEKGYGAKAQEILGQVKGRDFRHEKTKKKRGSYRGGLIDLDSHSIKFSYSDAE